MSRWLVVLALAAAGFGAGLFVFGSAEDAKADVSATETPDAPVPVAHVAEHASAETPVADPAPDAPTPTLVGRATDEWQGMRVDESMATPCVTSASCGLARACIGGACLACREDEQCEPNERCVLDHCVRSENTECATRSECGVDELCVLSGYSPGGRGNADMKAACLSTSGGVEPEVVKSTPPPHRDHRPPPVDPLELLDALRD